MNIVQKPMFVKKHKIITVSQTLDFGHGIFSWTTNEWAI